MSLFSRGLVASMESIDQTEPLTIADVNDGNVEELFEQADENPLEETSREEANQAIEVIEALEAYQDLVQSTMQFGGLNQTTAKAIEIGVQGLTKRYGIESCDVSFSLESFETPSASMRATQVSMESIGDVLNKVKEKAKDFQQKAQAAMLAQFGKFNKYLEVAQNANVKLIQEVQTASFEAKKLKGKAYPSLVSGDTFSPTGAVAGLSSFAKDYVIEQTWTDTLTAHQKKVGAFIESLDTSAYTVKDLRKIIDNFSKEIAVNETIDVTDSLTINTKVEPNGSAIKTKLDLNKGKTPAEVDSLTQAEALKVLQKLSKEIELLKDLDKGGNQTKMLKRLGFEISTEDADQEELIEKVVNVDEQTAIQRTKEFLKHLLSFYKVPAATVGIGAVITLLSGLLGAAPLVIIGNFLVGLGVIHLGVATVFATVSLLITVLRKLGKGITAIIRRIQEKRQAKTETVSTESTEEFIPESQKEYEKLQQQFMDAAIKTLDDLYTVSAQALRIVVTDVHKLVKDSM